VKKHLRVTEKDELHGREKFLLLHQIGNILVNRTTFAESDLVLYF
jgi:hypothetical protein